MEEEKYQKDLFEFQEPKRSFAKLTSILPRADLEGRMVMSFTMEKMVFISIGIVMAMVVVFALGVENGKARAKSGAPAARKTAAPKAPVLQAKAVGPVTVPASVQSRAAAIGQKSILNTSPVGAAKPAAAALKTAATTGVPKPYSVLAASFLSRDTAQTTVAMLRKENLSAFIIYNEPYYRVYVGLYADRASEQALKDLARVKRTFKDALIKRR
jgi:cell division septation protein DedD